jgi:hypothetical protein
MASEGLVVKPRNSWDYFDTLHGRATGVDPWRLFDLVAGEEYRRVRQAAEAASDKTWSGIFKSLRSLTGWSASRVDELRDREEAAELASGFPIAENVRRLAAGDRIVTDTYLERDQVRRLAERIGVPAGVDIEASWDGKHSGRWWQSPAGQQTARHVGDNRRSDVDQPRAAGIEAVRYAGGDWSPGEARLDEAGHWEVAGAARAARLQNPHPPGSPEAGWWDGAAATNVPFLLLAAAMVRRYASASGLDRVAFVSRDAILLAHAYHRLYNATVPIFHASRATLRNPSAGFLTYVKRLSPGTLFVDLHGTGKTVRQFSDRHGIGMAWVNVCGQERIKAHTPALVSLRGVASGTAVEVMNYHDEGRVIDVTPSGNPVRAPIEYRLDVVRVHRSATLCGIGAVCRPPEKVTADDVLQAAAEVSKAVPRELLAEHQVEHPAA